MNIYDFWDKIISNKRLKISFVAAFCMCFLAHAYTYFNATFFHDRVQYFMSRAFTSAARTKWMAQFIDLLASFSYLPWIFGVLVIVFLGISLYCIIEVLKIRRTLTIFLIAGLCATQYSFLYAHFYWPYEMIASLMFVCLSVKYWDSLELKFFTRFSREIIFICLSFATYGAYTTFGPTLVIVLCLLCLLNNDSFQVVFKRGLEYVGALFVGGGLYYLILRIFLTVQHLQIYDYGTEQKLLTGTSFLEILKLIKLAYVNGIVKFINPPYMNIPIWFTSIMLFLGISLFTYQIYLNWKKITDVKSKILIITLILIFPLSMGSIYILAFSWVNLLMCFTFVVPYIAFSKFSEDGIEFTKSSGPRKVYIWSTISNLLTICLLIFVYTGIIISNMAYMRIESNYRVSEAICTRIVSQIESTKGYDGTERIVFVGDFHDSAYLNKFNNNEKKGYLRVLDKSPTVNRFTRNSFTYNYFVMYYFLEEVMGITLPLASYTPEMYSFNINKKILDMPEYPKNGSIKKIGSDIIVKINEVTDFVTIQEKSKK